MSEISSQKTQNALNVLESSNDFIVVRRLAASGVFGEIPRDRVATALFLDTETTGVSPEEDKIIELGMLLVEFDPRSGRLGRVISSYNGFEDPGHPLSAETIRLTGITDDDVRGQSFDEDAVEGLIQRANFVVAHNSDFDRPFCERRFPSFAEKWWGCTYRDIDWQAMNITSSKLDYLAYSVGRFFYDGHRALNDTQAVAALMNVEIDGQPVMKKLLDGSRRPVYRIWATGTPFDKKDDLKTSGYSWSADASESKHMLKAWYKDVNSEDEVSSECEFISTLFPYGRKNDLFVDKLNGYLRFSHRFGEDVRRKVVIEGTAASKAPRP